MIHKFLKTVTVAAGSGSVNTLSVDGMCRMLYIKPETATTTYKVNITDSDGDVVKNWDFSKATLRDYTPLILYGVSTINITNSTADEDFIVKLLVEELMGI